MTKNEMAALKYATKFHFSVIPVSSDKKPLIAWQEFQKRIATEQEIRSWFQKWPDANVGIVTGKVSNLAIFDLDDDTANQKFSEICPETVTMPCAMTPRGGRHCYFRYPEAIQAPLTNKAGICGLKMDFRGEGGYVVAPPSINGNGRQYSFITGMKVGEVSIPSLPIRLLQLLNNNTLMYIGGSTEGGEEQERVRENPPVTDVTLDFSEGRRDDNLFSVANALIKGGMKKDDAMQVLKTIAKSWGEEHLEKWFSDKIKSAINREIGREICLADEVHKAISVTDGYFSVTEVYQALQSVIGVTNRDKIKNNIRQILHRMRKDGLIQKVGDKDGFYRRVEEMADEIEWWNAQSEPIDIHFPLGIEEYVNIYPSNIIIYAGTANAGKTAHLLNIAWMNRDLMPVTYLSSEMAETELKIRLDLFGFDAYEWKKIKFRNRSSNFSDIVDPNGLTIIDFLEINDNFYQIAALVKDIYDRIALGKGICVIGIQKPSGRDTGRGGEMGLEKPRLYISVDYGRAKIVKGKSWAKSGINPNGLVNEYKLVQGCHFMAETGWIHEAERNDIGKSGWKQK